MTIEDSLKRRLAVRLQKHGESDFSAQQLQAQLKSLPHFKRVKLAEGSQKFHLGARQGPPEARPKANPLESGSPKTAPLRGKCQGLPAKRISGARKTA